MTNKELSRRFLSFILALVMVLSCFVFASAEGDYDVTLVSTENGSVTVSTAGGTILTSQTGQVMSGSVTSTSTITVICTPDEHCHLESLTIETASGSSTTSNLTTSFAITDNTTISAVFAKDTYDVYLKEVSNGTVKVTNLTSNTSISSVNTNLPVAYGDKIEIECTTNSGLMLSALAIFFNGSSNGSSIEKTTGAEYMGNNKWQLTITTKTGIQVGFALPPYEARLEKTTYGSVRIFSGVAETISATTSSTVGTGDVFGSGTIRIECYPIDNYKVKSVEMVGTGTNNYCYKYSLTETEYTNSNNKLYTCTQDIKGNVKINVVYEKDIDYTNNYRWYRVKSEDELEEYLTRFANTSVAGLDKNPSNTSCAAHILIVYDDGNGNAYYVTDDIEDNALVMNPISGSSISTKYSSTASFFKTLDDLGTPMIKITDEKNAYYSTDTSTNEYALICDTNGTAKNINYYYTNAGQNLGGSEKRQGYTRWDYYRTYAYGTLEYLPYNYFSKVGDEYTVAQNSIHSRKYAINMAFGENGNAVFYYANTKSFPYYNNYWKYANLKTAATILSRNLYNIRYINYFNYYTYSYRVNQYGNKVYGSINLPNQTYTTYTVNLFSLSNAPYGSASTRSYSNNSTEVSYSNYYAGCNTGYSGSLYTFNSELYSRNGVDVTNKSCSGENFKAGFSVFIAETVQAPAMKQQLLDGVEGTYTMVDGTTIQKGTTIYVREGQTLAIDGVVVNNGTIVLKGGKLVVRGVLTSGYDTSVDGPASVDDFIRSDNNGTIIVLEGGYILPRVSKNLDIKNGSTLYVAGYMCMNTLNIANNSSAFVEEDGIVTLGAVYSAQIESDYAEGTASIAKTDNNFNTISITSKMVYETNTKLQVDNTSRIFITGNYEDTISSN